ncbi:hypothetical protein [Pseudofrankia sp. DC12]|uniref:hypothetical protein n=1 Tax=Pseudofrankia sp. DC12 TaxID=683315 RepID=UPI0005F7FCA3|nr:hypothetical protein [Pseudofrankia sp. DC12]
MRLGTSAGWRQARTVFSVAVGPLASFFLTVYLLKWAAKLDRHYITDFGVPVEIRTHAGLFVKMSLLGALPAWAGAAAAKRGTRWVGILVGLGCLAAGCICEAVVTYVYKPWFTF